MIFPFFKRKKKPYLNTIAFYNLENLFDTVNDAETLDNDFTPRGSKKWSKKRYNKKIYKLAKALSEIGNSESDIPPVIIGVAEVENDKVIQDLLAADPLKDLKYDYIHYDSPDERGIDCGLIYNPDQFKVLHSEPIELLVFEPNGRRDNTRDILYVKGKLDNEVVHVFVNHWPSRRSGTDTTGTKRMKAASTIADFMNKIEVSEDNPNYIVMGDFNDGPNSESVKSLIDQKGLYNPMEKLLTKDRGSASYKTRWLLFDQIIVSYSFLNYEKGTHSFAHANIFDKHFLTEFDGRYKGTPFRTYVGRKYIGGYSDHFPVYIQLKYNT